MILNFGHTIGHAIEGCYGFGCYTHGEGVAAGMSMLTGVTEAMGLTKDGTTHGFESFLAATACPSTSMPRQKTSSPISVMTRR